MSDFLENLKKSVDTGEFNSEAAKKIIEINKLAEAKENKNAFGLVTDRLEKAGFKESISEKEALVLNSAYEKKMEEVKKQDAVNKQLATLIEIIDMVDASVRDMLSFVEEIDEKFKKEFEEEDPIFGDLFLKTQEARNKYEPTLLEYKHKK